MLHECFNFIFFLFQATTGGLGDEIKLALQRKYRETMQPAFDEMANVREVDEDAVDWSLQRDHTDTNLTILGMMRMNLLHPNIDQRTKHEHISKILQCFKEFDADNRQGLAQILNMVGIGAALWQVDESPQLFKLKNYIIKSEPHSS